MKKIKKMMALVMCSTLVLAFAMTARAESQEEVVPEVVAYGPVARCPECPDGTLTMQTTRRYQHDERFPCHHYDNNDSKSYDEYAVYEVKTVLHCDKCSYGYVVEEYTEHIFKSCHGFPK